MTQKRDEALRAYRVYGLLSLAYVAASLDLTLKRIRDDARLCACVNLPDFLRIITSADAALTEAWEASGVLLYTDWLYGNESEDEHAHAQRGLP